MSLKNNENQLYISVQEKKGQRGVLVGDRPQAGPPQPPESPSPPLRVAPHGKQGAH